MAVMLALYALVGVSFGAAFSRCYAADADGLILARAEKLVKAGCTRA